MEIGFLGQEPGCSQNLHEFSRTATGKRLIVAGAARMRRQGRSCDCAAAGKAFLI
jgi:hypothetical protein